MNSILRDARRRAPQDEVFFFATFLFRGFFFVAAFGAGFFAAAFFTAAFVTAFFAFGRLRKAARCAAANDARAQSVMSSGSS